MSSSAREIKEPLVGASKLYISVSKPNLSFNDLSDDLLYQILLFLPSIQDVASCSYCSNRMHTLVHYSPVSETLFASLYKHQFGEAVGSKKHWKACHGLRQCAFRGAQTAQSEGPAPVDGTSTQRPIFSTMGILTWKQERQAFLYDNGSTNISLCMGYFGMKEIWEGGPVCVWGDFGGVRLFPSLDILMNRKGRGCMKEEYSTLTLEQNESRVLTVMAHGNYFFLGTASGKVHAISATNTKGLNNSYAYHVQDTATNHTDEVTSLSILTFPHRLISASCDGSVWLFPDSITKCRLNVPSKILSDTHPILCVQAIDSHSFWTAHASGWSYLWKHNSDCHGWGKLRSFEWSTPTQIISYPSYAIIGNNSGSITFINGLVDHHQDILRPVETLSRFGNNVIAGGGIRDGGITLIAMDKLRRDDSSFELKCHPGKKLNGKMTFSSVVTTLVSTTRQSLITLSRDGTIAEWNFETSSRPKERKVSPRKRPRPPEWTSMLCVVDTLADLMNQAEPNTVARTRMRIIQCAFQQKHHDTTDTFVGINGIMYKDIGKAFNLYSNVSTCPSCSDVFSCRISLRHAQGLDPRAYPSQLVMTLLNNGDMPMLLLDDQHWFCETCHIDNNGTFSKCRLCHSSQHPAVMKQPPNTIKVWECDNCKTRNAIRKYHCVNCAKQGGRIIFLPIENEAMVAKTLRSAKGKKGNHVKFDVANVVVMKQPANTIKMWDCAHCQHRNQYRKWNCVNCHRQGGIIVFIPEEEMSVERAEEDGELEEGHGSKCEESVLVSTTFESLQ